MKYDIKEHKHRYSVWTAGRAASVKGCRFKVEQAKELIESIRLDKLCNNADRLPKPIDLDDAHAQWRFDMISAGKDMQMNLTHGVAAKLINVYFKTAHVCGGNHQHERVMALHPPIDSLLLQSLADKNVGELRKTWKKAQRLRWSKLDSQQYQEVIDSVRLVLKGEPMWKVEYYWPGHQ